MSKKFNEKMLFFAKKRKTLQKKCKDFSFCKENVMLESLDTRGFEGFHYVPCTFFSS